MSDMVMVWSYCWAKNQNIIKLTKSKLLSARSAVGSPRAMLAWWPTAASTNVSRPSTRMTNVNEDDIHVHVCMHAYMYT